MHLDPPHLVAGIGVVAPFDFALDRELWECTPPGVALHVTRTPYLAKPLGVDFAEEVSDAAVVAKACRDLSVARPLVTAYLCTSGSFVGGLDGEERLRAAMEAAGAVPALTTSGALLAALEALGVNRVGVGTPYDDDLTLRLAAFLEEAGYATAATAALGLTGGIPRVSRDTVRELARAAADDGEVVFLSCTNLPTIAVLPELEAELERPVLSANLVTMWAALRAVDALPADRPERLFGAPVGGRSSGDASARVRP